MWKNIDFNGFLCDSADMLQDNLHSLLYGIQEIAQNFIYILDCSIVRKMNNDAI